MLTYAMRGAICRRTIVSLQDRMCSYVCKYELTHKTFWFDRHVTYLASKINFVDEDISAMMIVSRLKKDFYQSTSPHPTGKNGSAFTAGAWHELGMLTLLALIAHQHRILPAFLAPYKRMYVYTHTHTHTHKHIHTHTPSLPLSLTHTHTHMQEYATD